MNYVIFNVLSHNTMINKVNSFCVIELCNFQCSFTIKWINKVISFLFIVINVFSFVFIDYVIFNVLSQ